MYSLYQIFLYVSTLISIILALFVFFKNKKNTISIFFVFFCLSVCIWLFSYAQVNSSVNLENAFVWSKIGFVGILFIPLFSFLFLSYFIEFKIKKSVKFLLAFLNIFFIIEFFFSNFILTQVYNTSWGVYPHAGNFHIIFLIYSVIMFVVPIYNSYIYIQNPELASVKKQK